MQGDTGPHADADPIPAPTPGVLARSALGGVLMGLANLVPGISGGTMLLASGVYTGFISAIAEVTTLRLRPRSLLLLGAVVGAAALAILLLAGPTKTLVVERRWVMYSLFVGLTLGGVPLVWRMGRPGSPALWAGAAVAFAAMVAMALASPAGGGGEGGLGLRLLAGVAGASAMILPGVSGGYLLLLLGQYVPILGAVDALKRGLLGSLEALRAGEVALGELPGAPVAAPVLEALGVLIPVGVGVGVGVVGVSNLLRWLLERHAQPTLGALLGLLLGAVVGLWPFQEGVPPRAGEVVKGRVLDAEAAAAVDPEDWAVRIFRPSPGQAAGALALLGAGLAATLLISRLGRERPAQPDPGQTPSHSG